MCGEAVRRHGLRRGQPGPVRCGLSCASPSGRAAVRRWAGAGDRARAQVGTADADPQRRPHRALGPAGSGVRQPPLPLDGRRRQEGERRGRRRPAPARDGHLAAGPAPAAGADRRPVGGALPRPSRRRVPPGLRGRLHPRRARGFRSRLPARQPVARRGSRPDDDAGLLTVNVRRGDYYSVTRFRGMYSFDVAEYVRLAVARERHDRRTGGPAARGERRPRLVPAQAALPRRARGPRRAPRRRTAPGALPGAGGRAPAGAGQLDVLLLGRPRQQRRPRRQPRNRCGLRGSTAATSTAAAPGTSTLGGRSCATSPAGGTDEPGDQRPRSPVRRIEALGGRGRARRPPVRRAARGRRAPRRRPRHPTPPAAQVTPPAGLGVGGEHGQGRGRHRGRHRRAPVGPGRRPRARRRQRVHRRHPRPAARPRPACPRARSRRRRAALLPGGQDDQARRRSAASGRRLGGAVRRRRVLVRCRYVAGRPPAGHPRGVGAGATVQRVPHRDRRLAPRPQPAPHRQGGDPRALVGPARDRQPHGLSPRGARARALHRPLPVALVRAAASQGRAGWRRPHRRPGRPRPRQALGPFPRRRGRPGPTRRGPTSSTAVPAPTCGGRRSARSARTTRGPGRPGPPNWRLRPPRP